MISVDLKKSDGGLLDYGYGKTIRSRGLVNISKDANFAWASAGARIAGRNWEEEGGHDVGQSFEFLPYNGLIAQSRQESRGLGGPSPKSVIYVLVESEGSCSLEVSLLPYFESGANPSANQARYATGPASRGWARVRFVVTDSDSDAIKIVVSAASSQPGAKVWAVSVMEVPYRNLESASEPVALGDTWVGPYAHGAPAESWSRGTNDPNRATVGFTGMGAGSERVFRRGVPAPGVNSVEFLGSAYMAGPTVSAGLTDNLIGAAAVNIDLSAPSYSWASLSNGLRFWNNGPTLRVFHRDGSGTSSNITITLTDSGDGTTGWFDLVAFCSGGVLRAWINGELAGSASVAGTNDSAATTLRVGWQGRKIAMPAFFSGDFSEADVLGFIDYRRHVHGIF